MRKSPIILLLAVGLISCSRSENGIRVPGIVDGDVASIKAMTVGTLQKLNFAEGSQVGKGAVVAEVDRDRVRNALTGLEIKERELTNSEERAREKRRLARANADYWQKQRQRFERLKISQSVSGEQYEKTRLQSLEAQTALYDLDKSLQALTIQKQALANQRQTLELNERDLILISPVSGTVLDTFVISGETVFPGTSIADILDEGSLFVEVFVEENDLAGLKLGDHVVIEADGSAEPFSGVISFFGKKAEFSPKYIVSEKERQSLLYQVKVRILTGRKRLKLGMPVTVVFHD